MLNLLEEAWEYFVSLFLDIESSIETAIGLLLSVPTVDFSSQRFMNLYEGSWALALIFSFFGFVAYVLRGIIAGDIRHFGMAFFQIIATLLLANMIPFAAHTLQGFIGEINQGLVVWITDSKAAEEQNFSFLLLSPMDGMAGFIIGLIAQLGALVLAAAAWVITSLLPFAAIGVLIAFGVRWMGFLGDSLFRLMIGVAFVSLLTVPGMIFVLCCMWWITQLLGSPGGNFEANLLAIFAIWLAAGVPFALFWLYNKTLKQRVEGIMSGRSVSLAKAETVSGGSSQWMRNAAIGGGSALAGAVIAKKMDPDTPGPLAKATDSNELLGRAAVAASTRHPVAAVAWYLGSSVTKRRKADSSNSNQDL